MDMPTDLPVPLPGKQGATLANFNKVTRGMTPEEMLAIMGRENCSVVSSGNIDGEYAGWVCLGQYGTQAQFFFTKGVLEDKQQIGLR
ncbi:hypothetical protein [Streptodolium elevatio]|uniref:Uncharacterized protein n=1 Tax=Streptodolium elevatio TaxID=3157996 RepID=A0ABV3DN59_9ACTN